MDAAGKVAQAVAVANEAAGLEGAGTLAVQVRKHLQIESRFHFVHIEAKRDVLILSMNRPHRQISFSSIFFDATEKNKTGSCQQDAPLECANGWP